MENPVKYAMISVIILPMLLMIVVAIFSAVLVISDIPVRNRDLRKHSKRHR